MMVQILQIKHYLSFGSAKPTQNKQKGKK